jgi:hypothetical protein
MIKGKGKTRAEQALFRSVSDDGIEWLFVVLSDDGWAITCNGKRVAVGSSDRTSVGLGVQRFLSLGDAVEEKLGAKCA